MPGSAGGDLRIEVDGLALPLLIKGAILSRHRQRVACLGRQQHALCLRLLHRIGRRIDEASAASRSDPWSLVEAHPRDARIPCVRSGLSRRLPTREIGLDQPRVEARLLRGSLCAAAALEARAWRAPGQIGLELTGAGASGWAISQSIRFASGPRPLVTRRHRCRSEAGLTGAGASGWGRIDPVRVGAASSKDGLVLRRSWTSTLAASVARSVMGTMSVDFMVMTRLCRRSLAERVWQPCVSRRIELDGSRNDHSSPAGQHQHRCGALSARVAAGHRPRRCAN